jgi:Glycosyltransferase like family 2
VINATNVGFGGACTQGAELARGEHVLLLNNDTIPEPGWLSALVEAMDDPAVGIAGSRLLYPDRTIQHAGIAWNEQGRPVHVHRGAPAEATAVLEQRDFGAVTGACLLIRRDLLFEIGGFDDGYHMYVEDVDLCLRVWAAGHRVTYCPASVVVHLENASVTDVEWRDRHVIAGWQRLSERWAGRWPQHVRRLAWPVTLPGGPRHLAVLSLADDVLGHPELIAEWSHVFADQSEATLVIFGAGHEATTLGEKLRDLFAKIGVDGDAGPDVLVLAGPAGASPDPGLVAAVSAVLASEPLDGPLGGLPRVDETGIAELRETIAGGAAVAA